MAADEIICPVFRMGGKRWTGDGGVDEYNLAPVSFPEGGKRLADRWAESVRRAAAGNIDAIDTSELPSGTAAEIADCVDGAVGVVGAVGDSIGSALGASLKAQKPHAEKMAAKATAKCPGCHAPVAGRKGQGVVCSYCDTKFVL